MRINTRGRSNRLWHLMIPNERSARCSRFSAAAAMTAVLPTETVHFPLLGSRQTTVGGRGRHPFPCIGPQSRAGIPPLENVTPRFILDGTVGGDKPFDRRVGLRGRPPLRIDLANITDGSPHRAVGLCQPHLLRWRDEVPAPADPDLSAAATAPRDAMDLCVAGHEHPLPRLRTAARHARLIGPEAGLDPDRKPEHRRPHAQAGQLPAQPRLPGFLPLHAPLLLCP